MEAFSEAGPVTAVAADTAIPVVATVKDAETTELDHAAPLEAAVPASPSPKGGKISKLDIVIRQDKLDELKAAMLEIGITGMTVTNVLGCGIQHGQPTLYRGAEQDVFLLPRIEVEIVVAKVPVEQVIETAKKVLYTGHYGDGKIFVYDVENVVKVRTGEEGYDALQDVEQY